jgi:hypothetical protein
MKHLQRIPRAIVLFITIISGTLAAAEENTHDLGREDAWARVGYVEGIQYRQGLRGFLDIVLVENEYAQDEHTELLLHFNDPRTTGNPLYELRTGNAGFTDRIKTLGQGSALFTGERDPLVFIPKEGALFSAGNIPGSFSVEFWIYPVTLSDGEIPFLFSAERLENGRFLHQEIRCITEKQRLVWRLANIFLPRGSHSYTITVRGTRNLIPRTWSHHIIRYDAVTGLVEYVCDGIPQAVTYASETGGEGGTPLFPYIGAELEPKISIGSGFSGLMDEFRLSSCYREDFSTDRYSGAIGTAVTRAIDLGRTKTTVTSIGAEFTKPSDTDIGFWIRAAERMTDPMDLRTPWIPFVPGEAVPPGITGRYIQLRMELYTDGIRQASPTLSEISITYASELPLMPPVRVSAVPGNGSVTLMWNRPPDNKANGFLVYYGERPGVYWGTGASIGDSPADVGNVTSVMIEGLKNGTIYYFSLIAYDSSNPEERSAFSGEISCRPVAR